MTAVVEVPKVPSPWPVYLHALLVGVGWAPLLLAFVLSGSMEDAVLGLPQFLLGPLVLGLGLLIFPPAWPVLLATAWRELDMAERLERTYARQRLHRIYRSYAFVFAAVAALALALAIASLGRWGMVVNSAWIGPGIMAGIHDRLAAWIKP